MKFIWIIAGTVLAGLILGFWVSRAVYVDAPPPTRGLTQADVPTGSLASAAAPLVVDHAVPRPNPRWRRIHQPRPDALLTNWEERIQEILVSGDEEDTQAKEMLELFPRLPLDGQIEVVDEVGSLLSDNNYGLLAAYTTNSTLAEPVLEALMVGLMDRPDPIRLPLLLSIAEDEQHPKSEEAIGILEAVLGQEYGTNWEQWNALIDQRLNAQPQQETPETMESMTPDE